MNNPRKNHRRFSGSSHQTNNKISKTNSNSFGVTATKSEDVPELPGLYYDHVKQKYFKIGSNNFGVASVVTTQSIAKKSNDEEFTNLNRVFKKTNDINILNTLTFTELKGYNSNLKIKLNDCLIKKSHRQKLYTNPYDTFIANEIREIQAVQINDDEICLLENSSIDLNLYYSSVKKFRLSDLDKLSKEKQIDFTLMGAENNRRTNFSESSCTKMYFHSPELFVRSDKNSLEIQLWKANQKKNTFAATYRMNCNVAWPILCSALSNQKKDLGFPQRILIGSEKQAALASPTWNDNHTSSKIVPLNTKSSAAYCVSFSNTVWRLIF